MTEPVDIFIDVLGGSAVVMVRGSLLDAAGAARVAAALDRVMAASSGDVVVDLYGVWSCDPAAAGSVFADAARRLEISGRSLVLRGAAPFAPASA